MDDKERGAIRSYLRNARIEATQAIVMLNRDASMTRVGREALERSAKSLQDMHELKRVVATLESIEAGYAVDVNAKKG